MSESNTTESPSQRHKRIMAALDKSGQLEILQGPAEEQIETLCVYLEELIWFLRTAKDEPCEMRYYPSAPQLNKFNQALEDLTGGSAPAMSEEEIEASGLLLHPSS